MTRLWSLEKILARSRHFALPCNCELRSLSRFSLYDISIAIRRIQRCLARNRSKRLLRLCEDNNSSYMASNLWNSIITYAFADPGTFSDTCIKDSMASWYAWDFLRRTISILCENEYRDSNLYLSEKIAEAYSSTSGWQKTSVFIVSVKRSLTDVVMATWPGSKPNTAISRISGSCWTVQNSSLEASFIAYLSCMLK